MIRTVIDTNVLVSGLLSPNGNAALVLLAVHQGLLHPCFSDAILDEYIAVLGRPRFGFQLEEIEALLRMLRAKGEFFSLMCCQSAHPIRPTRNSSTARSLPARITWSPATSEISLMLLMA